MCHCIDRILSFSFNFKIFVTIIAYFILFTLWDIDVVQIFFSIILLGCCSETITQTLLACVISVYMASEWGKRLSLEFIISYVLSVLLLKTNVKFLFGNISHKIVNKFQQEKGSKKHVKVSCSNKSRERGGRGGDLLNCHSKKGAMIEGSASQIFTAGWFSLVCYQNKQPCTFRKVSGWLLYPPRLVYMCQTKI